VLSGASDELALDELGDELLGDGRLNRVVILGLAGGDNYRRTKIRKRRGRKCQAEYR